MHREILRHGKANITGNLPKLMVEAAEKVEPEMMKAFYPRIYENTGAYGSPKVIAAYLTDNFASAMSMSVDDMPTASKFLCPTVGHMLERKMPLLFLAPQLLEAIKRTDFPHPINWMELQLPYEHGCLVLPKGALVHPTDGEAACIFWGRMKPDIGYKMPAESPAWPSTVWVREHCSFHLVALCPDKGMWYDSNITSQNRPELKLNNLFYAFEAETGGKQVPAFKTASWLDSDLDEKVDGPFVEQMGVIMFGTLLALQARPDLLTKEKLNSVVRDKKKGTVKEFWSPNVIGKDYRLPEKSPVHSTHASPRMHWRRGHFREQKYGVKLSQTRSIWIEPSLVNAGEKE